MNDDEIAVASCLEKMKVYVETGKDFYSLKEAAQDTYLSFMIEKAIGSGEEIVTENSHGLIIVKRKEKDCRNISFKDRSY